MRRRHRRRCKNKRWKNWRNLCTQGASAGISVRCAPALAISDVTLDGKARKIYNLLPKLDCGSCGYESCLDMAKAIANGKENPNACFVAGDEIAYKIERILGGDA